MTPCNFECRSRMKCACVGSDVAVETGERKKTLSGAGTQKRYWAQCWSYLAPDFMY
jgi:hypothetical protein